MVFDVHTSSYFDVIEYTDEVTNLGLCYSIETRKGGMERR
jgi:hypothetical protein